MITSSQPRAPLRAIALVGFMGAGKTSVGRELAERLAIDFIDLDDLVIARQQEALPWGTNSSVAEASSSEARCPDFSDEAISSTGRR